MNSYDFPYQLGHFIGALILPGIWLLLSSVVPPLKRRQTLVSSIAVVFVWLPVLGSFMGAWSPGALVAAVFLTVYCYKRFRPKAALGGPPLPKINPEFSEELPPKGKTTGNYFARHWRGELGLGISYWVNLVLLATVLPLLLLAIVSPALNESASLRVASAAFVLFVVLALVFWLWGIVGVWRSATAHTSRGGKWGSLAKLFVVFGVLSTCGQLVSTIGPHLREFGLLALGLDPLGKYEATILSGGRSIHISGMLREGSAADIIRVIEAAPSVTTVVLTSPGGRLGEAKLLADFVRQRDLNTYVESMCNSACTYVFLAGKERAATPAARIGFHAPSFPGADPTLAQRGREDMVAIYRQSGIPEQFIQRALKGTGNDMWFPTREELLRAGVITRTAFSSESTVAASKLKSKAELAQLVREVRVFVAMEQRFPALFSGTIDRAWDAKTRGGTDGEIMTIIRSSLGDAFLQLLAVSDDQMREKLVILMVQQIKVIRAASAEACERYLNSALDPRGILSKELIEAEENLIFEGLARPPSSGVRRNAAEIEAAIIAATARLPERYVDVIRNMPRYKGQSALLCDSMIALYESVLNLERGQRYAVLEGMFMPRK